MGKPSGFFSDSDLTEVELSSTIPRCGLCGLYRHCKSPKMKWTGKGRLKTLIIAESPGEVEDEKGVQLVGKSGQLLRLHLSRLGVNLDIDCWKTNSVICRPKGELTEEHIEACRPCVNQAVTELKPEKIILLGGVAVKSLIGALWRGGGDIGGINTWAGWRIPCQKLNAWICPTYHPSFLLRQQDQVLDLWFHNHLEEAFVLQGRPWPNGPPDYASQVECIYSSEEAAYRLRKMLRLGGTFCFDYETNQLKPEGPSGRIVSCAVCRDGEETIAFAWHGEVISVMGELVRSEYPKLGWNIKFEHRWTKKVFGYGVRNWVWDGMQAAHVLDNRSYITSAKFQAFVMLGVLPWDRVVGPYLEAKGGNDRNRIEEVDLRDLLRYNGMDALCEFLVIKKQMDSMG